MNAIYILWLRQLKRHFRSKPRMIGSLGQPLLFLLALGFGFGPIYQRAGGGNYLEFLAPGIIAMSVLFTAMFAGIETIWDRQFGFLKETLVAPVSRFNIMLGRTFGGATVAVFQGIIVMIISVPFGFRFNIVYLPLAIIFMIIIAILFTAIGTAIASLLDDMHAFSLIMNFLIMPLFFLSGALFPLDGFPPAVRAITSANPLTYGVDGLRVALTTATIHAGILNDFAVLLVFTLVFLGIGSYLFSRVQV